MKKKDLESKILNCLECSGNIFQIVFLLIFVLWVLSSLITEILLAAGVSLDYHSLLFGLLSVAGGIVLYLIKRRYAITWFQPRDRSRRNDEKRGVIGFLDEIVTTVHFCFTGVLDVIIVLLAAGILVRIFFALPMFWKRTVGVSAGDFVDAIVVSGIASLLLLYATYGIYMIIRFQRIGQARAFVSLILSLFLCIISPFRLEFAIDPAAFVADKTSGYYYPSFRDCARAIPSEDAEFFIKEEAVRTAGYREGSCYCGAISTDNPIEYRCGDYYQLTGAERPAPLSVPY